jgi:DNA-binding beta-propeller fold protein YncE
MSTPWDLANASLVSADSLDVSAKESIPTGVWFKSDGSEMYITGQSSDAVHQYNLSTNWDPSSGTFDSSFYYPESDNPNGFYFSNNGDYLIALLSGVFYRYPLTTAWDISTASTADQTYNPSTQDSLGNGMYIGNSGAKLYLLGGFSDTVYEYDISTTLTINTLDLSTGSVFEITPTSDIQVGLSNPAASGTVSQATLLLDGASDNYNLSSASYDSKNFYVGTQEANSSGIFFHPQGTSFWMTGISGDDINQYALSTPWDVSTASLTYTTSSIAANSPDPRKILFNTDGTKVFILSQTGNSISEYSCAAFSTPSVTHVSTFSVSAQLTAPIGAAFNNNGTKLYVTNGNIIYQYSLSTAFDISTTSYDSKSFTQSQGSSQMYGIRFNTTGTKMYGIESANDRVHQYTLSTPDDISTASYDSVYFSVTQTTTPFDLHFKPDGTKMYVLNPANDRVYQYSTGTGEYTITYPSALEFAGGTAPTSPSDGETDVITFSTTDGGTSYQAVQAIDGAK